MNILMAGNDRVYTGMELAIYSTMTHNKNINWFIFTMDITIRDEAQGLSKTFNGLGKWERNKLRKIVKYLDNNSNIVFIDTYDLYMQEFLHNPNEFHWLSPYAPLRLLADIALPEIDDVLYLDCDTAVQGDISDMYYSYLKMGYDYYAYKCVTPGDIKGEMVSGIMLMDLAKMRETNFLVRARENVRKNAYRWYDQDAIAAAGDPYPLPETYSYLYEIEKAAYDPIILHFTNQLGPKIYSEDTSRDIFYKKFHFLNYVKEGVEKLDNCNFNCGYSVEEEPELLKPHIILKKEIKGKCEKMNNI